MQRSAGSGDALSNRKSWGRAVRGPIGVAFALELVHVGAIEEEIDVLLAVTTGQDHGTVLASGGEFAKNGTELRDHGRVHRVPTFRPVEGDPRQAIHRAVQEDGRCHE